MLKIIYALSNASEALHHMVQGEAHWVFEFGYWNLFGYCILYLVS